jgi:hypothetical protein
LAHLLVNPVKAAHASKEQQKEQQKEEPKHIWVIHSVTPERFNLFSTVSSEITHFLSRASTTRDSVGKFILSIAPASRSAGEIGLITTRWGGNGTVGRP